MSNNMVAVVGVISYPYSILIISSANLSSKKVLQGNQGKHDSSGRINSSPLGQNGYHFADDIFRCIFMNEKCYILIKISLQLCAKGQIDNNPVLV